MATTYTSPGGADGTPVSVAWNYPPGLDPSLIPAIEADLAAGLLVAQEAPPDPFVPAPPLGGYTIVRNGGVVNATGQQAIVAGNGAPATVTGGGAAAQTVISGTGGLTFTTSSGATTIAAGGTGNVINLLGGTNKLETDIGNGVVGKGIDTIAAAAGTTAIYGSGNLIALGSGSTLIETQGVDTVVAGTGSETIGSGFNLHSTSNEVVYGGASKLTFIAPPIYLAMDEMDSGANNVVLGGTGSDTIFSGGFVAGGSAGNNVIVGTGVLRGGGNGDQLFGVNPFNGIIPGNPTADLLAAGSGNETLSAAFEHFDVVMFAGNNVITTGGAVVTANDVMGGGSNTPRQTFFAGTGNAMMIGGQANAAYGPRSDLFVFVNGRAGGTDAIYNFNANDHVILQGYQPDAAASALTSATVAGGSTAITLADNTTILFQGVTNLTSAAFV